MVVFSYMKVKSKRDEYDLTEVQVYRDRYQFKLEMKLKHLETGIETDGVFVLQLQRTYGFKHSSRLEAISNTVADKLMKYFNDSALNKDRLQTGRYELNPIRDTASLSDLINITNDELGRGSRIPESLVYSLSINKKKHKLVKVE